MATTMTIRARELRRIAAMLAVALAFASLPSGAGLVIVSSPTPTLTLDICHPLPGVDRTSVSVIAARPAPAVLRVALIDEGSIVEFHPARSPSFIPAPDPPPPKPRA